MRIRKTLAKALGQANPESESSPPSEDWIPPFCFNTLVDGCSSSVCQLNQSPWDVYPNHRFFRTTFKCYEGVNSLDQPKEKHEDKYSDISEKEEDVLGSMPIMETVEEKPLLSKRVNAESTSKKKEATEKKDNNEIIILCKKHDGRNWFCKKVAKLPHYFCEYHLAKSQSYYQKKTSGSEVPNKTKKQKNKATRDLNSDNYYYGTVAPSRGKRRARNFDCASNVIHIDGEKVDKNDALGGEKEDAVEVQDHMVAYSSDDEEKVQIGSKRARKPTKFRSLNSFPEMEPKSSASREIG